MRYEIVCNGSAATFEIQKISSCRQLGNAQAYGMATALLQ